MNAMNKKRVGLLGGSFDPVHYGHLGLAGEARERFRLDHVLLVPANISPHKQEKSAAPSFHRLEMLRRAIRGEPAFEASDIELKRGGISYTIDTLKTLRANDPEAEFYLIMGVDTFQDLGTWKDYRQLMEGCHLLVATRPGFSMGYPEEALQRLFKEPVPYQPGPPAKNVAAFNRGDNGRGLIFYQPAPRDISSREIRGRVHQKGSIKNMLPPQVEHYIISNNLYQIESSPFGG